MDAEGVATLVALVGRTGAIQALACSEVVKADDLRYFARILGIPVASKKAKKELARQIVRHVDRRISKSVAELQALDRNEIRLYLDATGCDTDELRELLAHAGLPVQAKMSRDELMTFAAIEISSLGMFERLGAVQRGASRDSMVDKQSRRAVGEQRLAQEANVSDQDSHDATE